MKHKELVSMRIFKDLLLFLAPIFILLRNSWQDKFYGDPMDSRMSWVIYEHWFKFFQGERELRDALFFFPYDKSLGLSDAFLLNGIFHSIFRLFNVDAVNSWKMTNISLLLISIIGIILIAKKLFTSFLLQLSFSLLILTSYSYVGNLIGQPNVSIYFLGAYFLIGIMNISTFENSKSSIYFSFAFILLIPPLLILSTWYSGFFLHFIILTYILIYRIFNRKSLNLQWRMILKNVKTLSRIYVTFGSIVSFSLYLLFIYIYLPNANTENILWSEVSRYQPSIFGNAESLIDISSYLKNLIAYDFMIQQDFIGIGLVPTLIFLYLTFRLIFSSNFRTNYLEGNKISLYVMSIFIFIFFLRIGDFSIFRVFWELIDPLKSIRFTPRIYIYLSPILIYLFIDTFQNLNLRKTKKSFSNVYYSFIILFCIIIQFPNPISTWPKSAYEPDEYKAFQNQIKLNCSSFVVDSPGRGWWDDQLQGMNLMSLTNVPTANGYSGGFPKGYPLGDWSQDSQLLGVGHWLLVNNETNGVCLVKTSGIRKINFPVGITTLMNFDVEESNDSGSIWNWSLSKTASIKVLNFSDSNFRGMINFEIRVPDCIVQDTTLEISDKSGLILSNMEVNNKLREVGLDVEVPKKTEIIYNFFMDIDGCKVDNGMREVFFLIKDLNFFEGRHTN